MWNQAEPQKIRVLFSLFFLHFLIDKKTWKKKEAKENIVQTTTTYFWQILNNEIQQHQDLKNSYKFCQYNFESTKRYTQVTSHFNTYLQIKVKLEFWKCDKYDFDIDSMEHHRKYHLPSKMPILVLW